TASTVPGERSHTPAISNRSDSSWRYGRGITWATRPHPITPTPTIAAPPLAPSNPRASVAPRPPEGPRATPLVHTERVDERKVATVLFADLVGSTELGAGQDPERTRVMLERFYAAMAAEVEEAGGTVEKFAGDAVMAAFGAPVAYEDH